MEYSAEAYLDLYDQIAGEADYADAIQSKHIKVYRARTERAGRTMKIDLCAVWNARGQAVRAQAARRAQSAETIAKRNARATERKMTGLINANFGEGDYALYLTFDHAEVDVRKALRWFVARAQREHKRRGVGEFRYLYMIESADRDGAPIRTHIHIFVDGAIDRDWYETIWRERYGIANATKLRPDENGLTGFAKYIQKAPRGVRREHRWACSRNLQKPTERRSTRLPDGKRLTKKFLTDLANGRRDVRETFEHAYPGWRFVDMQIRTSEHVAGVYVEVKMTYGGERTCKERVKPWTHCETISA